jgi:hypothetical protein
MSEGFITIFGVGGSHKQEHYLVIRLLCDAEWTYEAL